MTDAGYTLTETLAALAVLGMAVGGLSLGAQVIGPLQLSTGKTVQQLQAERSTQQALEQLLEKGAPFGSQLPEQLSGDTTGFHFACGGIAPCTAQIVTGETGGELKIGSGAQPTTLVSLPLAGPAHFVYRSSRGLSDAWPPSDPVRQALKSITLLQTTHGGDVAVIEAKVWVEQRAQCDFDSVIQDCR
jgi:prepilin-type N-terminal cleavage/methylation domain-containing protein